MSKPSHANLSIWSLSAPVAMGYVPLGAVFGFLFVKAGGAGWLAVLSSLLVYAGAAQFMMVPMLAAGEALGAIGVATLVLNLRHMFYGLSLLETMPQNRLKRWYGIFALTDETYSVLTALPKSTRAQKVVTVSALNQGWWVLGTLLGVVLGANAELGLTGLDFALAALFSVLAVEQWRGKRNFTPIWFALGSYALAWLVWPAQALLISIGISLLLIGLTLVWANRKSKEAWHVQ